MKREYKKSRTLQLLTGLLLLSTLSPAVAGDYSRYVDARGNISLPQNFRTEMAHLGSWFVPDGEASGFHDVYTQPSAVAAYSNTGQFPDGAVLVKELRAAEMNDHTTGKNVSNATSVVKQWFVMIKDTQGRFKDNPSWGDGWGWALFKPDAPQVSVTKDYQTDCLGCHVPARKTDWIYVQAYPTLRRN